MLRIIAIYFMCIVNVYAIDWQDAANISLVVDWGQTRYIADSSKYHETNSLLGKYPTTGDVNRHFVGSLILVNGIGYALDNNKYWYMAVVAKQLTYIIRNKRIGVEIKF